VRTPTAKAQYESRCPDGAFGLYFVDLRSAHACVGRRVKQKLVGWSGLANGAASDQAFLLAGNGLWGASGGQFIGQNEDGLVSNATSSG